MQAQLGIEVDRRHITLDEPLKELGVSDLVGLASIPEVTTATLRVEIVASLIGPRRLSPLVVHSGPVCDLVDNVVNSSGVARGRSVSQPWSDNPQGCG